MTAYLDWLARERGLRFAGYEDLWRWSVEDLDGFWSSVWDHFDVLASAPPTAVLGDRRMPGATWFAGARLNLAENVLRYADRDGPAVVGLSEGREPVELSWAELAAQVASFAAALRELGVRPGDRVAAYLPNIPQAVVALLATASVGAIWSCCAPDFGTKAVVDRFQQIAPTVLIAVDGYRFGGKDVDRGAVLDELRGQLPIRAAHDRGPAPVLRPSGAAWRAHVRRRSSARPPRRTTNRSRSTIHCGSCTARARPGCPRGSCTVTAASCSNTSSCTGCISTPARRPGLHLRQHRVDGVERPGHGAVGGGDDRHPRRKPGHARAGCHVRRLRAAWRDPVRHRRRVPDDLRTGRSATCGPTTTCPPCGRS